MISRNRRNSFFFVWFLRRGSIYNPKHKDHHDEQWKNRRTKCDRRHRCSMVHSSTTVWSFLLPPPASPPLVSLCRAASSALAIVRTFFFMLFVKILDELAGPRVSVHVGISTEAEGSLDELQWMWSETFRIIFFNPNKPIGPSALSQTDSVLVYFIFISLPVKTKDAILVTNLIFVFAMFVLIPMKASTIRRRTYLLFERRTKKKKKISLSFVEKYVGYGYIP